MKHVYVPLSVYQTCIKEIPVFMNFIHLSQAKAHLNSKATNNPSGRGFIQINTIAFIPSGAWLGVNTSLEINETRADDRVV